MNTLFHSTRQPGIPTMHCVHSRSSAARTCLMRTMASLAAGVVLRGTRWNYRILDPIKGDTTHISNAFKAEVIPREKPRHVPKVPRWFVRLIDHV